MSTGFVNHLTIDTLDVAWTQVGPRSPRPLVLLHGLGDSSIMTMDPIAQHAELADKSVVLIDLPGFGHSRAPTEWPAKIEDHATAISAAFVALGLQDVTLVGHSMGGSLALLLAWQMPNRIRSLILAEPLLIREQSELARAIAKRDEDDFVTRGHAMLLRATRRQASRGERAAQSFLQPLAHADPAILHRSAVSLLADRSPSFLHLLRNLTIPRTLLVGERTGADMTMVPEYVDVVTIQGAGHAMMSDNPEGFARAVAHAIERHKSID